MRARSRSSDELNDSSKEAIGFRQNVPVPLQLGQVNNREDDQQMILAISAFAMYARRGSREQGKKTYRNESRRSRLGLEAI
jgi:hypothetical protein